MESSPNKLGIESTLKHEVEEASERYAEIFTKDRKLKLTAFQNFSELLMKPEANFSPRRFFLSVHNLTAETVDENYWKMLSEERRLAFDNTSEENKKLKLKIASLEKELKETEMLLTQDRANIEKLSNQLN